MYIPTHHMVQFDDTHGIWINHMSTNTGYQVQTELPETATTTYCKYFFWQKNQFFDGRILEFTEGRNSLILHSKISLTWIMSTWILCDAVRAQLVPNGQTCSAVYWHLYSEVLTEDLLPGQKYSERQKNRKRRIMLDEWKTFKASVTNNPGLLIHDTIARIVFHNVVKEHSALNFKDWEASALSEVSNKHTAFKVSGNTNPTTKHHIPKNLDLQSELQNTHLSLIWCIIRFRAGPIGRAF